MGAKNKLVLAVILGLILQPVMGSGDESPAGDISRRLEYFSSYAHPQKVYIHLDKAGYQAGETIWFRAYLFDGVSHKLDADTNNIFLELIDADGSAMDFRILMAKDGFATGDIRLNSDFPEGNYIIRAYTDWMRNFGEDHYYTHHLYIKNPGFENRIPRREVRKNRRFNRKLTRMGRDYEISFYPESGNLLAGTGNRVAFKVVDGLGHGRDSEGEVIDDNGNVLTEFRTDHFGAGVFEIEPESGRSYHVRVSVDGDRKRSYDLPDVITEDYTMRVDQEGGLINISVASSIRQDDPLNSREMVLVGHTRGMPRYEETFRLSGGRLETSVDKNLFPSGIAHFTLFTGDDKPVAERLIFIEGGEELYFSPRISTVTLDRQDYFDLQLRVSDKNGNPVKGSFSLSAITGKTDPGSYSDDIFSYVLLGSDMKGTVANLQSYLQGDPLGDMTVDDLLLTYKWERFDWSDVLGGELPEIRFAAARGLTIGGRLMDPAKNESLTNHPVQLKIGSGYDDLYTTSTARGGAFAFTGLVYEGEVEIELSSRRLAANYPPVFDLSVRGGRGYDYDPGIYTRELRITQRGDDWERVRGISRRPYRTSLDRDVSAQHYGVPDQTIFIDYKTSTERNLYEVLRNRATGLTFDRGQIIIRGQTSINLPNEARFMLDGMFVDRNVFLGMYPRDIERIEIFRGASAAIFGVRGGTGVILGYSRRPGYRGMEDVLALTILGYHLPAEFSASHLPKTFFTDDMPEITVYWEPELRSDEDGRMNIRFPLYKGMDKLRITVEGAGFDGGIGFSEFNVDVDY